MVVVVLDVIAAVVDSGRSIAFVVVTSDQGMVIGAEVPLIDGIIVVKSTGLKLLKFVETPAMNSSACDIVTEELIKGDIVAEESLRF